MRLTACALAALFFLTTNVLVPAQTTPARPPLTIITDQSWDVGGQDIRMGEYPLSGEQIAAASAALPGGTYKAVAADYTERSKVIPGTIPIWRTYKTPSEVEGYQFRKTVPLGPDPIVKATLEINCDDIARVYINQRLVSVDQRDGKMKDGYDDWYTFRSVSGFTYNRVYTYDVTDYFFTHVTNTIFVEAISLAFDGGHAYVSAKIVLEFAPLPEAPRPAKVAAPPKHKPAAEPAAKTRTPDAKPADPKPAAPEKTVFEAGSDPDIDKLSVGSILELGNVFFKADEYQLDSASYRTLDALASFMKRHPGLKIEVGGHTNLWPSDSFAAELSENRARAVTRYLTDKGVSAGRATYKGYGKTQPRVRAKSKEANRANQRVEVKVLEK